MRPREWRAPRARAAPHTPRSRSVLALLCEEKGFDETRVRNALKRLEKARSVGNQSRMDSFFGGGGAKKDPFAAARASGGAAAGSGGGSAVPKVGGVKRRIVTAASGSRKK